jgi:mitogen-activated protein kinase 1/3
METDLHRIIYSRQPLTLDHVQYFVYQILRGLKYIHSANVIHRDLKPSNLLVNANCDLKICDFGLARGLESDQPGGLTEYVVTRWYRAPEIMLACHEYTKAIDVWSVGCIFAELLARQALFPGDDYIAQLRLISEKMGRPSEADLDFVTSERAKRFMLSLPVKKPVPMAELFPEHKNETEAHSLVKRLLTFHPRTRVTVEDALEHPFLGSLHNLEDEPVADFQFPHFAFEDEELSKERVQELIWEEIRELYPDIPETYPRLTPRGKLSSLMEDKLSLAADDDAKISSSATAAVAERKQQAKHSSGSSDKK